MTIARRITARDLDDFEKQRSRSPATYQSWGLDFLQRFFPSVMDPELEYEQKPGLALGIVLCRYVESPVELSFVIMNDYAIQGRVSDKPTKTVRSAVILPQYMVARRKTQPGTNEGRCRIEDGKVIIVGANVGYIPTEDDAKLISAHLGLECGGVQLQATTEAAHG